MNKIRNRVKAIIIQEEKMLFNKCKDKFTEEVFYGLPGGGQNFGETFTETLKRECLEEIGAEISVGQLVLVREYIGKNHEFAYKDSETHQMEYMFLAELKSAVNLDVATNIDACQIGIEWLELSKLKESNVYPKILKEIISEKGEILSPVYLGDVN